MADAFAHLHPAPSQGLITRAISMSALHQALRQLKMFQQELCSELLSLKTSTGFINMGFFLV